MESDEYILETTVSVDLFSNSVEIGYDFIKHEIARYSKEISYGLVSTMRAFVAHKSPILPTFAIDYVDFLPQIMSRFNHEMSYSFISLVLMMIPMHYYDNGTWKKIVAVSSPPRDKITHMGIDTFNNLGIRSTSGYTVLSGYSGSNSIDYIKRKEDGTLLLVWYLTTEKGSFPYAIYGNKYVECDCINSFAGEIINDKCFVQFGMDRFVDSPSYIAVSGVTYTIVPPSLLTLSSVLYDTIDGDGLIVSVLGTEYKLKYHNTVELRASTDMYDLYTTFYTMEGIKYKSTLHVVDGIYECTLDDKIVVSAKERPDKLHPQMNSTCSSILCAPKVTDFKRLLYPIISEKETFNDIYPLKYMILLVRDNLGYDIYDNAGISLSIIMRILHSKDVVCEQGQLDAILRHFVADKRYGIVNKHHTCTPVALRYASCSTIYNWFRDQSHGVSVRDALHRIANAFNVVVSIKRITLMIARNQLLMVHGLVYPAGCCGNKLTNIPPGRAMVNTYVEVAEDPFEAWLQYGHANSGKHSIDTNIFAFNKETIELLSLTVSTNVIEEFGDILLMATKVLLEHFKGANIYDKTDPIWSVMSGNPIIKVVMDKYRKRLQLYGCIRNHVTAEQHVCNNGQLFTPDDEVVLV